MGTHLQVVMFHHIRKNLEDVDLRCKLLTFVLAAVPQREVHQQGRCILHRIVAEVVLATLEDLDDPRDDSALDHVGLRALAQTELLQGTQRILSQVRVIAALRIKCLNEHRYNVVELEKIAASLVLIS